MSRYYFHIRDGRILVRDEEGVECRSMNAVQDEARASARDMIHAALGCFAKAPPASIEIEAEDGNEVGQVTPAAWLH